MPLFLPVQATAKLMNYIQRRLRLYVRVSNFVISERIATYVDSDGLFAKYRKSHIVPLPPLPAAVAAKLRPPIRKKGGA